MEKRPDLPLQPQAPDASVAFRGFSAAAGPMVLLLLLAAPALQPARAQESVVASPPAFSAGGPSVVDALADVRDSLAARADGLERAEAFLREAVSAYRDDRSNLNFARVQAAMANFLAIDFTSRLEVSDVAVASASALGQFVEDLDRVEGDQQARRSFPLRRRGEIATERARALQGLGEAGVTREQLLDPARLGLAQQEIVLGTLQRLDALDSETVLIAELESQAEEFGDEFAAYRDAVRHDAMQLRLLGSRAEEGVETILRVAEASLEALDLIALRETMQAIEQSRGAWGGIRFQPISPAHLGPRPLAVPVAAPPRGLEPSDPGLRRLVDLLGSEGETRPVPPGYTAPLAPP